MLREVDRLVGIGQRIRPPTGPGPPLDQTKVAAVTRRKEKRRRSGRQVDGKEDRTAAPAGRLT